MDLEYIEKFCQQKGLTISKTLFDIYDSTEFEINSLEIEKEIHEISTSYSRILFFEAKQFLEDSVREEIKLHPFTARIESRQIKKLRDVDLVAYWIKSEVVMRLENKNIFFIN